MVNSINPEEFSKNVNIFFVTCNLLEETFNKIKPELQHEYKQAANRTIQSLNLFNRLVEKVLPESKMEVFDESTQTLFKLIECSNKASEIDKQEIFINKLKQLMEEL